MKNECSCRPQWHITMHMQGRWSMSSLVSPAPAANTSPFIFFTIEAYPSSRSFIWVRRITMHVASRIAWGRKKRIHKLEKLIQCHIAKKKKSDGAFWVWKTSNLNWWAADSVSCSFSNLQNCRLSHLQSIVSDTMKDLVCLDLSKKGMASMVSTGDADCRSPLIFCWRERESESERARK